MDSVRLNKTGLVFVPTLGTQVGRGVQKGGWQLCICDSYCHAQEVKDNFGRIL